MRSAIVTSLQRAFTFRGLQSNVTSTVRGFQNGGEGRGQRAKDGPYWMYSLDYHNTLVSERTSLVHQFGRFLSERCRITFRGASLLKIYFLLLKDVLPSSVRDTRIPPQGVIFSRPPPTVPEFYPR